MTAPHPEPTIEAVKFVQARWFRKGRLADPRLIVVHCTVSKEMGTGAEAVANYFAHVTRKASAHVVADNNSMVRCVLDGDTAYGAGGANHDGLHLELVGMPDQTTEQWLDPFGLAMFATCAPEVNRWMAAYGIPPRWLTIAQLRDGKTKGLTTHADVEEAFPSTGHSDPGAHFPRATFLAAVGGAPPAQEDDMPLIIMKVDGGKEYWISDGMEKRAVGDFSEVEHLRDQGGAKIVDYTKVAAAAVPVAT